MINRIVNGGEGRRGELAIGEVNAVEGLELFAEIFFERDAVTNVGAVLVLEALKFADEALFDLLFFDHTTRRARGLVVGEFGVWRRLAIDVID